MIGLFLGDTDFSDTVLKKIKKLNKKYFILNFFTLLRTISEKSLSPKISPIILF